MAGELRDDIVTVSDQKEGCQIYNKGNYGYPLSGGGIDLDLLEATYLLESKRLEVVEDGKNVSFERLFKHASAVHDDFDIRYMVYRDMRERGFVIKTDSGDFDFAVFPRGMTTSNSRPEYMVKAISERAGFDLLSAFGDSKAAEDSRRKLLYAVVDEEGDLTYYAVSTKEPHGDMAVGGGKPVSGDLIKDRVFVFDPADAETVHGNAFFGKMADQVLQLSLMESCYLMKRGLLNVSSSGKAVGVDELTEFSDSVQNEFRIRLTAFTDLRDRGLLVKTGFKYGTHFRVYEKDPDKCHARYLVHSVRDTMTWPEVSRTVRLTHGVKKEILFSHSSESTKYIEFKRFRP
jgi:tRNA-intron endonuclease